MRSERKRTDGEDSDDLRMTSMNVDKTGSILLLTLESSSDDVKKFVMQATMQTLTLDSNLAMISSKS